MFTRGRQIAQDPDAQAVARCRAGDTDAFGAIVERYQPMVGRVVARALRYPEDAEDVTQEVFIRAFRSLNTFRGDARFSTWLYRIALNTAMRHASKIARYESQRADPQADDTDWSERLPSDVAESPESVLWKRFSESAVRDAVHALPEKHRAVIILHFFENKSGEEIAEITGARIGTVWSRIHYAVRKLKESLSEAL